MNKSYVTLRRVSQYTFSIKIYFHFNNPQNGHYVYIYYTLEHPSVLNFGLML